MQFIEALKVESKLFILFLLMMLGFIMMGVMGSMQLYSMKKNIDEVYLGSLISITKLNEIIQTYYDGLENSAYKASRRDISPSQTASQIHSSINYINKKWMSYESHFKRDDEQSYVDYTSLEIKRVNNYFFKIYLLAHKGDALSKLNINRLEEKVSFIHSVIQKLINYEKNRAVNEREKFVYSYEKTKRELSVVLILLIIVIVFIFLYIIKEVQREQTNLEITTKKLQYAKKKLKSVSYTDSLTNLYNRRYFHHLCSREMKRAKRSKNYITFIILDIDYFKEYNEIYGHIEGDNALKSVASILKERLQRPSDYVFRLGGSEFGILLTETNELNSVKIAREINDVVKSKEIKHVNSTVNEVLTLSIGLVCCIANDALEEKVFISKAEEMLCQAKEKGRDRYAMTSNVSMVKGHDS